MTNLGSTFWSGETLNKQLKALIKPFNPDRVDCAAYTLSMGSEIYVSPTSETVDPKTVTVCKLDQGEAFTIPPGQFAFLLTEETVSVPGNALAFISIRAKTKFRGLVNVSGFHVDPGYCGQLTFAVFNAGPVTIHLKRGEQIFLIWYASLDQETEYKKHSPAKEGIDIQLISGISGELHSFSSLSSKITDIDRGLGKRIHNIEKKQVYFQTIFYIVVAIIISTVGYWLKGVIESAVSHSPATTISVPYEGSHPKSEMAVKTRVVSPTLEKSWTRTSENGRGLSLKFE